MTRRAAPSVSAKPPNDNRPPAIASSTTPAADFFIQNGKPTFCECSVNAALTVAPSRASNRRSNGTETKGMSQERKRTSGRLVPARAVWTPPIGPNPGKRSLRMTQGSAGNARTVCAIIASMVILPNRRAALGRPIRRLNPPARMQTSKASSKARPAPGLRRAAFPRRPLRFPGVDLDAGPAPPFSRKITGFGPISPRLSAIFRQNNSCDSPSL